MPRVNTVAPWTYVPAAVPPNIPQLNEVWWRIVSFVTHLRVGSVVEEIDEHTEKINAELRRRLLPTASMFVFGVDLSVAGTRIPDEGARAIRVHGGCLPPARLP